MKEHYVSFEQADALKKLGFDEECRHYYVKSWTEKRCKLPSRRKHPRSHKIYMDALNAPPMIRLLLWTGEPCTNSDLKYQRDYSSVGNCISTRYKYAVAPRLDQAQAWLREVKGVAIYVIPRYQNAYKVTAKRLGKQIIDTFFVFDLWDSTKPYPTYEAALSAGITEVLKLLEENN